MSISTLGLVAAFLVGAAALSLAWAIGFFRARTILGPPRLSDDVKLLPLLIVTGIGAVTWLGPQIVYGAFLGIRYKLAHPQETFTVDMLDGKDYAFLATAPGILALVVLLIADMFLRRRILDRIGFTFRKLPRGVFYGLIGAVIILPVMFCAGMILDQFYKLIHYDHPAEHDLLRAMKDLPPGLKLVLIVGATVVAPVFEEFFFRGHLQTVLVRLFMPRVAPIDAPAPMPIIEPPPIVQPSAPAPIPDGPAPPLSYAFPPPLPVPKPPSRRSPALTWLAVIITSIIFSSVHPLWTFPLIFILSMGLGYAYERTGILWTNIVIHAAFNGASTLVYLKYAQ